MNRPLAVSHLTCRQSCNRRQKQFAITSKMAPEMVTVFTKNWQWVKWAGSLGGAANGSVVGAGGFNGGGNGGRSCNNEWMTGAGGGGASDIRLYEDDGTLILKKSVVLSV